MHHSSKSAHDCTKISTVSTEFAVNIQNIIIIIIMLVYRKRTKLRPWRPYLAINE